MSKVATSLQSEPQESVGTHHAFGDRVRLYLKVTALINLVFSVSSAVVELLGMNPTQMEPKVHVAVWSVTALNGLVWFAIARSRPSTRVAIFAEGIVTLMLADVYAWIMLGLNPAPSHSDELLVILLVTIVLVLRAGLVPSPTFATFIAGVMTMSVALGFSFYTLELELIFHVWATILASVVVAVTTVTTHTIYGLHLQMVAATQLGQYQLDRRVGQGAMGEVYLATHAMLQRPTAVKLLKDVRSASARARFRQEVQTASGLSHPNTVEIYDYGRTPDGIFYFAMEYVEGASLADVVHATGPMAPGRVVQLLKQAAGSLREAHERGLVHRDIKPNNLMLCERGGEFDTLKVLDFGLVRDLADAPSQGEGLTGTPLYMAPETILDGNGFLPESDVYALGATAYFLLAGSPPFQGELAEVLSDHLASPPPEPPTEDRHLAELVLRCLAKDAADRPADAGELLKALDACESNWSTEDARIWWAEHREVVDAVQDSGSLRSGSSPRSA